MQGVIPHAEIAPLLQQNFVALASDCDDAEEQVEILAGHLEDAYMLPFVLFADAQGKFLGGSEGAQSASSFLIQIERLLAQRR